VDLNRIIMKLGLIPHPEGGHYRETYRASHNDGDRGVVSSIYYLLGKGEISLWHRVDAVEIWNFHAGDILYLEVSENGFDIITYNLGFDANAQPQAIVPAGAWQRAWSKGDWTLVGCTVAPAFEFDGFELAPSGWSPSHNNP